MNILNIGMTTSRVSVSMNNSRISYISIVQTKNTCINASKSIREVDEKNAAIITYVTCFKQDIYIF